MSTPAPDLTPAPELTASPALDRERRRIDAIDDQLQDLLRQRAEVVLEIARLKAHALKNAAGDGWYRPTREALVLRRLLARHRGPLPKTVMVRLWREILGAALRLQTDFRAAAFRPADGPGTSELARDHFGGAVPLALFSTPSQVVAQVADGKAQVGIVPLPQADEAQPWWPSLARQASGGQRIVARLPFAQADEKSGARSGEGLVVAVAKTEPTGRDRTLVALEGTATLSRARLREALDAAGLPPAYLIADLSAAGAGKSHYLADLSGHLGADDARLASLKTTLDGQVVSIVAIGAYAEPLGREELGA